MKREYKFPEPFSDRWVKEIIKALGCPTFKFKQHKEPKINSSNLDSKQLSNLNYILNLTKD